MGGGQLAPIALGLILQHGDRWGSLLGSGCEAREDGWLWPEIVDSLEPRVQILAVSLQVLPFTGR